MFPTEHDVVGALLVWGVIFAVAVVLCVLWLWHRLRQPPVPPGQPVRVVFINDRNEAITVLNIKATDPARTLRLVYVDAEDNPTTAPEGVVPTWAPIDPVLGSLDVSPDGLTAQFTPGSPTSGQISVDAGNGLSGVLDVVVVPGDAVRIAIAVDPVE